MNIFGVHVVAAMLLAGGLGGVLFGYRTGGLAFPHWDTSGVRRLNLGFIADLVWGGAGALVVFIIVPLDLRNDFQDVAAQLTHQIKLLAIAFVGGYGGPAIVDLALSRTFDDLAKRTEEVAQQTEAVQTRLAQREEQEQRDIRALELVDIQLGDTMRPVDRNDLVEAVKVASPAALENIFQRAKQTRHHAWLQKHKGEESHQITERTIAIFQGLLASHYGKQRHRYHAQLGYALKDQDRPNWEEARESLENAATLLEEGGRPMSPHYKFNWALCAIEQDTRANPSGPTPVEMRRAIADAIVQGSEFEKLKASILHNERIHAWLERNGLTFDSIGIPLTGPLRAVAG